MGKKRKASVAGYGDVFLNLTFGSNTLCCRIENLLHVISFEYSSLSVSTMNRNGVLVYFEDGECKILKDPKLFESGHLDGYLYVMSSTHKQRPIESTHISSLILWHYILAHMNHKSISQMVSRGVGRVVKISPSQFQGHWMCGWERS